ncbi:MULTISPECIES: hypothetical protein [Nostocales]|uniref:Uncharacterized protein n=3 Tax=Nostocales TaxID=1161 RepID=A0A8S9T189_9CYAN|nr:hypothetical protein [Tolypothrix bouteillei]KAF3885243.1 hypothetical protein DA73_0400007060 [Tolypothrix bouteillei VB521301]
MSYYEFDNHFWSPQIVCSYQSELPKPRKTHSKILVGLLTLLCLSIWTPLVFQILVAVTNTHEEVSIKDLTQSWEKMSEREIFLFYRSSQQQ